LIFREKKLPFFDLGHSLISNIERNTGIKLTPEELYERYGFGDYYILDKYPEYTRFVKLLTLADYRDNAGFVDKYRQDKKMKAYVSSCAESLDMPVSVVVGLIANQNLRKYIYSGNIFRYIGKGLTRYKGEHGSFKNISKYEPELFEKLNSLKKQIVNEKSTPLTTEELIEFLQVKMVENDFNQVKDYAAINEVALIEELREIALQNGNLLARQLLTEQQYSNLLKISKKYGMYPVDFISSLGISYVSGRRVSAYSRCYVSDYPYLYEMRAERDKMLAKNKVINKVSEEEAFVIYLDICREVYDKYKQKIFDWADSDSEDYDL